MSRSMIGLEEAAVSSAFLSCGRTFSLVGVSSRAESDTEYLRSGGFEGVISSFEGIRVGFFCPIFA